MQLHISYVGPKKNTHLLEGKGTGCHHLGNGAGGARYGIMVCSGSMSHIINFVFFEVNTTFLKLNLKKLGTIKDSKHYKFTNITLFSSFFV